MKKKQFKELKSSLKEVLKKAKTTEVCANGHTYKVKTNPNGCPDCRILRGLDDVPCDYQIIANAAAASKRK